MNPHSAMGILFWSNLPHRVGMRMKEREVLYHVSHSTLLGRMVGYKYRCIVRISNGVIIFDSFVLTVDSALILFRIEKTETLR